MWKIFKLIDMLSSIENNIIYFFSQSSKKVKGGYLRTEVNLAGVTVKLHVKFKH